MTSEPALAPVSSSHRPRMSWAVRLVLIACALACLLLAASFADERLRLWWNHNTVITGPMPASSESDLWHRIDLPGIDRPPIVSASAAHLPDHEEVLGVEILGHARAYRVHTLANPTHHVINDLIEDQPVSMTYCDMSDCARGFLGDAGTSPLDLGVGGIWRNGLVLRIHGRYYAQNTGENPDPSAARPGSWPLTTLPITRTTWAAWKTAHPDTDVYEGTPSHP